MVRGTSHYITMRNLKLGVCSDLIRIVPDVLRITCGTDTMKSMLLRNMLTLGYPSRETCAQRFQVLHQKVPFKVHLY